MHVHIGHNSNVILHKIMYTFHTQVVLCISVDVSSDYSQVESVIKQVMLPSWQQWNISDSFNNSVPKY